MLIAWIADAVIAAAEAAKSDFQMQTLVFTRDTGWLKIARAGGRVVVHSRP